MARYGIKRKINNIKPEQVFEAAKTTFTNLGLEIYKMRPFAYLVQARTTREEGLINVNVIASPFAEEFSLTLKSETESQSTVDALAEKILSMLENQIGL
jgi:hypothetical protein